MSIRLRKATIANAIEDVAQPKSAQEGAYQGPRILSDAPVRAVVDLSQYRTPQKAVRYSDSVTLVGPNELRYDLITRDFENTGSDIPGRREGELYAFLRYARIRVSTSGSTGNAVIQILHRTNIGNPASAGAEEEAFVSFAYATLGSNDDQVLQVEYDAIDQSDPDDTVVLPSSLIIYPSDRLVLEVDNNTDADVDVDVSAMVYQFNDIEVLI
jgi:hypothetical protein